MSKHFFRLAIGVFVLLLSFNVLALAAPIAAASKTAPKSRLAVIDPIIKDAIERGNIPGAVVVVGHNGRVVYRKAFGYRSLEPRREKMTLDTIFDMPADKSSPQTETPACLR